MYNLILVCCQECARMPYQLNTVVERKVWLPWLHDVMWCHTTIRWSCFARSVRLRAFMSQFRISTSRVGRHVFLFWCIVYFYLYLFQYLPVSWSSQWDTIARPHSEASGTWVGALHKCRVIHIHIYIYESFYGIPPNISLTTSTVSKRALGRISWNMVSLDTPTSSIDRPLRTRKCVDTSL